MDAGNPFDQFGYLGGNGGSSGGSQPAAAPAPAEGNPFDKFGYAGEEGKSSGPKSTATSLAANAAAGTNEAVTGLIGAPVDAANWAMRKVGLPVSDKPFMGSDWLRDQEARYGGSPDQIVPQTEAERIARGTGAGVASALLPAGAVGAAEKAGALTGRVLETARAVTGAADAGNAAVGGAAGAGGQAAADAVPDKYKPLAATLGALAAGGAPIAAHAAAAGAGTVGRAVVDAVPPLTAAGKEAAARTQVGRELNAAATDRGDAVYALQTEPSEIVPGSKPTLGTLSGDPGLVAYEKAVSQSPEGAPQYEQRLNEQNNARAAHLASVQPEGNALDLPEGIRAQRAATDAATQGAVDATATAGAAKAGLVDTVTDARVKAAEAAHQNALEGLQALKPDASPADVAAHFRATRDALDQSTQAQVEGAQAAARDAQVRPVAQTAEQAGAALREPAVGARAAAKDTEGALWKAVDPTGRMTLPGSPIADAAKQIASEVTESATPMAGEEARIFGVAQKYGDQTPFRDVRDLRSSISTAMREARQSGDAQSLRRLTLLRGAVEDSIDHAVENQAALDQIAVRRGTVAPDQTMEAKVRQWAEEHLAARQASARTGDAEGTLGTSGIRPASDAGAYRAARQGGGQSGNNEGSQGLPQAVPIDAAAGQRVKEASAATKDRVQTFDQGPVGKILERGKSAAEFKRSDASVPQIVFHPGPTGGEDVRAYLKAAGPEGAKAAADAAALSLTTKALRPDGTLDASAASKWIADHKAAIAELPPEVRRGFETSIEAQQRVTDALASRREAMGEFDKSEAAKVAGLTAPGDIVNHVGSILDSKTAPEKRLGDLAKAAQSDPAAADGLKRAVVEHVLDRFVPEIGDPKLDRMQAYLADKGDVLSRVLSQDEVAALKAKTDEARAAAERVTATQADREQALKQAETERKASLKAAEADRAAQLAKYDSGALGQLRGVSKPGDVMNIIKGIFASKDGAARMQALADEAAKITGGSDALKKAVTDFMERDFTSNTASGASDVMQMRRDALAAFMKTKTDALKAAGLSDEQIGKLRAIVDDAMRANRVISMAKARGGSDTSMNALQAAKLGKPSGSIMGHLALESAIAGVGTAAGGVLGLVGAKVFGDKLIGALRQAGLDRVKQLRVEAVLNPDLGLALMNEVPKLPDRGTAAQLALRARQLSLAGAMSGARQ